MYKIFVCGIYLSIYLSISAEARVVLYDHWRHNWPRSQESLRWFKVRWDSCRPDLFLTATRGASKSVTMCMICKRASPSEDSCSPNSPQEFFWWPFLTRNIQEREFWKIYFSLVTTNIVFGHVGPRTENLGSSPSPVTNRKICVESYYHSALFL